MRKILIINPLLILTGFLLVLISVSAQTDSRAGLIDTENAGSVLRSPVQTTAIPVATVMIVPAAAMPVSPRATPLTTPLATTRSTLTPAPDLVTGHPVSTPSFNGNNWSWLGTVMVVIAAVLGFFGVQMMKKNGQNQKQNKDDSRCGSIKNLLDQKKNELQDMIRNWPQDKLKEIAQGKAIEQLKKDEQSKKVIEKFEALKVKYDKLNGTIEMLQKKYDLCTLETPNWGHAKKYRMKIIKGSLTDPKFLDNFSPKELEQGDDRGYFLQVDLNLDEIKEVQKRMIKHYAGPKLWYMDGHAVSNIDEAICAFGADDGEGGRIFVFKRDDQKTSQEIIDYAVSKGISKK